MRIQQLNVPILVRSMYVVGQCVNNMCDIRKYVTSDHATETDKTTTTQRFEMMVVVHHVRVLIRMCVHVVSKKRCHRLRMYVVENMTT